MTSGFCLPGKEGVELWQVIFLSWLTAIVLANFVFDRP
jgi:hypothetical protein